MQQQQVSPREVNAFFEPAAAAAACTAESIMTMPADRLAHVAWPLLTDDERTLSMRDVFFTPPMRVSASPRATEAAFAAGVQSCLEELTSNLAHVHYGETPLSMARLRAAALAYQISIAASPPSDTLNATSSSSPLQRDRSITGAQVAQTDSSASQDLFEFALPAFMQPEGNESAEEKSAAAKTVSSAGARAATASTAGKAMPTTVIHSNSHNHPPDSAETSEHPDNAGAERKGMQSDSSRGASKANDTLSKQHDAENRANYDRKARSFVTDFVNAQWESVVACAVSTGETNSAAQASSTLHDNSTAATVTAATATTTTNVTAKESISASAPALLRRKIVRTAIVLCRKAPTCAAAGHSFVCLLKHALRAVAASDTIRGAESDSRVHNNTHNEHKSATTSATTTAAAATVNTIASTSATTVDAASMGSHVAVDSPSDTEAHVATVADSAAEEVLQLHASFWVEVVLALLHCVPLVQWTDDVLPELGHLLEAVTAAAPPKLIALAQQQQQQQQIAPAEATLTTAANAAPPATASRHGESASSSSRVPKCCVKKPPFSSSAITGSSSAARTGHAASTSASAEQVVSFTVRIPFKVGLPKPAATQAELLNALYYGTNEASSSSLPNVAADRPSSLPPQQSQRQQQPSLTNESATSAVGNNVSSLPSSAFHEVPDIPDEDDDGARTEEMSVVDEEEEEDEYVTTTTTTSSAGSDVDAPSHPAVRSSSASSSAAHTERASALNVSVHGSNDDDEEEDESAFGVLFGGPRGDFEALPCSRRRTQMVEFSLPAATRVSVRLLETVDWEHQTMRGRDILLLPLESASYSAEESAATPATNAASAAASVNTHSSTPTNITAASAVKAKRAHKDTLPLSLQSIKVDRNEALTYGGPCRVAIPSLAQESAHMVPGEVVASLQLTLDTRWATEWTAALASAQRGVAEQLLSAIEAKTRAAGEDAHLQRRSRVAGCVLLRGGLKSTPSPARACGIAGEAKTYAAAAAAAVPTSPSASAAANATAAPVSATAGLDPFVAALQEMPLPALRARVRCHSIHAEGVRATLIIIAHVFLQDRPGYLHGDPLTWHTAAWSDAVRRVSLASNVVGSAAVSGEAAMDVALFFVRHVASGCAAANTTRAQVIDAAIDLMSIAGLSLTDVKAALEERRQISSAMWIVVDLLTKCSAILRAPKHVALVAQNVRRLLLLGSPATHASAHNAALSASQVQQQQQRHRQQRASAHSSTSGGAVAFSGGAAGSFTYAATSAAASAVTGSHYLTVVNGCGRATEMNLRRGVHALLTQLFRLLKALLHRIQSTQAAPHRFLLESWEYGAFAVYTVSLMAAPMDASDVQLCAPFFADVVTGLLPSFTRLSRTESLLLTSESEEHKFLVEVAKHVRGRASTVNAAGDGSGGAAAEAGEADTPASREPQIVRKVEETATTASTASANGEGVGVWDVLQGATAASWTPGHVRVEIWKGSCSGFYVGLASADLPADVCGPERDPQGIYFMGDGTLQYGRVTRKQRRLPRWHAGDVVELNFVFAKGNWDVVMALNGISMVRLTLPRRDFRLVAVNVRAGEYVPGHNHVHVLTVSPIGGKGTAAADKRHRHGGGGVAIPSSVPPAASEGVLRGFDAAMSLAAAAPADVRLSPFSRLTVFNVSLFLELVLHYLVLHSSRQHYPSLASAAATASSSATTATSAATAAITVGATIPASAGASHGGHVHSAITRGLPRRTASSAALTAAHAADGTALPPLTAGAGLSGFASDGVHLVQVCTAPLQHSLQQLVHLLHDLAHSSENSSSSSNNNGHAEAEAYEVKRTAAQHITNAMLLDLVVTLSISLPTSTATLAMTVDVLTAVVECEAVARRTRTVALSALYNAITQHMFSEAISPVHAGAMRRLWTACYRLASEAPGYQPRFSAASVPANNVVVYAGGRRIEHRRVSVSTTLSGNVRSMSYACTPIELDSCETPDVVRVSVRLQRGFQCETLGRYYYFGLADIAPSPVTTPAVRGNPDGSATAVSSPDASTTTPTARGAPPATPANLTTATATTTTASSTGELLKHPGERAKQRRAYYISDYLSEVPDVAVQKADVDRAKNYLNPESNIIFGSGDVVTAVVYVRERCIGFERNGLPLNVLYRDIPAAVHRLYPFVELYNRDSRAKWMYPPDEAAMSARYTMRAMLLSWPNAVLPLVKEFLPKFGSRFGGQRMGAAVADPQSLSASLARSLGDVNGNNSSNSNSNNYSGSALARAQDSAEAHDVVLGVLGADGDEMRMVYVAPPQLDQPGGRAQSVRVERFERGMAVVSDEAGSLLRVCAAALEPDTTQELHVAPSAALRAALQACLPELAMFATRALQEILVNENNNDDDDVQSGRSDGGQPRKPDQNDAAEPATANTAVAAASADDKRDATVAAMHQVVLPRPATLLRVLRLIFSLHGSPTATSAPADRSGHVTPQANALSLGSVSATLVLVEPTERAMLTLLPLLDALLPAAQLDLPAPVLLREAWNELWCNPRLRQQVDITVPRCINTFTSTSTSSPTTAGEAKSDQGKADLPEPPQAAEENLERSPESSSNNSEEIAYTYAEPAGITYASSAQRFDDRVRAYRVEGDLCLCPSCGQRWSACTAHHTVPSSWCDLLDRVLRLLQHGKAAAGTAPASPAALKAVTTTSPYCGWFTSWTDGPLDAALEPPTESSSSSSANDEGSDDNGAGSAVRSGVAPSSPPAGDDDRAYHSPASAQSSDAQLWEDAEDTSEELEEGEGEETEDSDDASEASGAPDGDGGAAGSSNNNHRAATATHSGSAAAASAAAVSSGAVARDSPAVVGAAEESKERAAAAREAEDAPMTLVVRRAAKPASAGTPNHHSGGDEVDSTVYVEGSGETRQGTFTFTGSLISPTLLRGQMLFDRVDLPDAESDAAANQEWACPLCTFLNEPSAVRCAICANAKPGASWTCPVCSYAYNTLASPTCVTCGCMRPSSVRRLHDAAGPSAYCTQCHQREHVRNFHAMRHRRFCATCGTVTRWLPKDKYSTTIEARLVGDGGMVEFQWALDGYNTVCFGLRTRAYSADVLWGLVDAAARRCGSTALKEVGCYVAPIPERPLSTPSSRPLASSAAGGAAVSAAAQPCMVGAIVYYASALVLRYARLLPVEQLAEPGFLRRLHVCGADWLDSWSHFPASVVTPIFAQCLKLLQDGVRQPELVSTIATVALALIRQQPRLLDAEKHALLYALCLNVVRYGDTAQRKASYSCISALMEDDPAAPLNVQPLVPVLSMEPLLEGQQRATVLALLHHASMNVTPAIAKACACMARTVEAMEHQRPLPPMLGKPFPYLVALTETRLNEGGELLVGQVRGSVGVAPNKGGKYYYEVEVPHEFTSDRSKTIVMGWGTVEHERIASAQHVGSDLHSWGFNCRENLRLMMTEQALPVPRRPNQGDVIGSMMDLETMMVCWTINGQEISWVSVPAQGDGEEIFPYVSAAVEPQSVKIRLGNTRFKPPGYQDYTPPSDRDLWTRESSGSNGSKERSPTTNSGSGVASTAPAASKNRTVLTTPSTTAPPSQPPQSYEFYQQLSRALEEASITTLDDTSIVSLLDTTTARSILRQYPKVQELMTGSALSAAQPPPRMKATSAPQAAASQEGQEKVHLLIPYIQRLRRTQELTIVVARHLPLIEKSPYLMSCYKKATDLLFSSGRWTIFELQPGGRPKYSGAHAFRVLVSVRKARHVRKEADAEWLAQHPGLIQQQQQQQPHQLNTSSAETLTAQLTEDASLDALSSQQSSPREPVSRDRPSHDSEDERNSSSNDDPLHPQRSRSSEGGAGTARPPTSTEDEEEGEEEEEYVDVESDGGDDEGEAADGDRLTHSASLVELRNALQDIYGDSSQLTPAERRLRCSVTGQLFTQLEKTRVYQRARMFAVQLEGTLAVDAGGVTRAVMSMVGEELSYRFIRGLRVDPLLPLFQLCGHSTVFTVVPNMSALYASEAADDGAEGGLLRRMFEWLGKLIGNMVLCGTLKVPFDFPRLLWKTLTFQEDTITLADYAYDIDDNITAALEDDEFVLSDDFFAALPEHVRTSPAFLKSLQGGSGSNTGDGHLAGGGGGGDGGATAGGAVHHAAMPSTRPLRPYVCMTPAMSLQDMSHLALEELEEYAADAEAAEVSRRRTLAQEALLHQYDPAFFAIRAGLTAVVPAASLRAVRWEDLRARVCGNGAASTEHVLAELDMSSLPPSMRTMLTQVLNNFTESQLSRFLLFCSGQSRIPLPEKVLVNCGDEAGRLPTAHTCSPISLLLQPCATAAELQNSLEACLTHASEFGFV